MDPTTAARTRRVAIAVLAAAAPVALTARSLAAPCEDLDNPVYLQVGDTQEPLVKELGRRLADDAAEPMTLVYVTSGSCTNIEAVYTGTPITITPRYVPSSAEDPAWTPKDPTPECEIPAEGVPVDLGNSATFVDSCTSEPPPPGVGLFTGPIQAYLFVVPEASSQVAITAEEGYFTFGFGAAGQIEPWNVEELLFVRPATKSTALTTMAAVGVPAAKVKGVPFDKSGELVAAMLASPDPERSIGLLGAEIYDRQRDTLNALAFRAFGQHYAYYPDSTATALDKQNVRDGHYTPWSPTVYLAAIDEAGDIADPRVARIVDLILGRDVDPPPSPVFDPLEIVVGLGLIPDCAMKVQRAFEGGDLSLYDPAEPCHCFFEEQVGALGESCVPCADDAECGAGQCNHGWCEGA